MGKYDGILLCTDFDGTLYFEKNITAENIEAIRCFQENGGFFTVATGRFPSFIKEFEPSVKPNTHHRIERKPDLRLTAVKKRFLKAFFRLPLKNMPLKSAEKCRE